MLSYSNVYSQISTADLQSHMARLRKQLSLLKNGAVQQASRNRSLFLPVPESIATGRFQSQLARALGSPSLTRLSDAVLRMGLRSTPLLAQTLHEFYECRGRQTEKAEKNER